jgi:hypothetical protein
LVADRQEALFKARLFLFENFALRGEYLRAETLWQLLDPMGRVWSRSSYRPGDAEYFYAISRFWQGTLRDDDLANAKRLAREGKNRYTLRGLQRLHGELLFEQCAWQLAAESLHEAVRMAHEVGQTAARSETLLALAKVHLGQLAEPRQEAERLCQAKQPFHRGLAELWLAIGDKERAKEHALSAYQWAWADGEPYDRRAELNKSRALLERLGVEVPNLPPYDPKREENLPWEDEVVAAIERFRAKKAVEEQPEGEV